MESGDPSDRPESPKKKIRPTSTTNDGGNSSDTGKTSVDALDMSLQPSPIMNGVAPTRRNREVVSSSRDAQPIRECVSDPPSTARRFQEVFKTQVQEEVVSSSENRVPIKKKLPSYSEGNADSLTCDVEDTSGAAVTDNCEAEK